MGIFGSMLDNVGPSALSNEQFRLMFDADLEFGMNDVQYLVHIWHMDKKTSYKFVHAYVAGFQNAWCFLNYEEYLTVEYQKKYDTVPSGDRVRFTYSTLQCEYIRYGVAMQAELMTWEGTPFHEKVRKLSHAWKLGDRNFLLNVLGISPLYSIATYDDAGKMYARPRGDDSSIEEKYLYTEQFGGGISSAVGRALLKNGEPIFTVFNSHYIKKESETKR